MGIGFGCIHYLFLKTRSIVVLAVIAISYGMLWYYFNAFFYRIDFKGISPVCNERRQQIASLLLSGVLAYFSFWVATTIARELAALQHG
jgi:hypothetical protein